MYHKNDEKYKKNKLQIEYWKVKENINTVRTTS